ncbi:hypothetical protein BCD48_03870 [Pseudofrankia sp. BMG5.36]|nr:hypothetical protein BCD48_03870 [Pseudofrankia sp. BMG5.36]
MRSVIVVASSSVRTTPATLCAIARRNGPRPASATVRQATDVAPADSPVLPYCAVISRHITRQ